VKFTFYPIKLVNAVVSVTLCAFAVLERHYKLGCNV